MKISNSILGLAVSAGLLAVSCIRVEFEGVEGTPESVDVTFSVSGDKDYTAPPAVNVIMSRLLNTVHYVHEISTDTSADSGSDAGQPADSKEILNGDYYIMAFNKEDDIVGVASYDDAGNIASPDGTDAFGRDVSVSMKSLNATVAVLPEKQVDETLGADRTDFNPSLDYLTTFGSPFYVDVIKQTFFPGRPTEVVIEPKRLTQHIVFRFDMGLEDGVVLESIVAEVSGAAGKVELMSGLVKRKTLYRILLPVEEVSRSATSTTFQAETELFGLFPAESSEYISGAGILRLYIHANIDGKDKLIHAGINMKNTIEAAGLMKEAPELRGYRIATTQAVLTVPDRLVIRNGKVEDGQGVDKWFGNENIDVEL